MWRALALLVVLLLGAGLYAVVTGGAATAPAAAGGASSGQFGFALAAGCIALFAAFFLSRPKLRFRR